LDISDSEIKYAITLSSPKKAPGPDGITFEILHHAYTAIGQQRGLFIRSAGYEPLLPVRYK